MDEVPEEIADFEFEGATKLSPADFARLIRVAPQTVHYYARQGVIEKEMCVCGRVVIDIERATANLSAHKEERRGNVDTRADEPEASE